MAALFRFAAAFCATAWLTIAAADAQSPPTDAVHLGVATCSGGNCHGATERPAGSSVPGDEYIIWSKRDKHRQAYAVLLGEPAIKMARALGLPDAAHQSLCLDCHADNVPPAQRGRQFQLSDGVGCEACHGGASAWLGLHISGASHRDNLAAGLYPIEQPVARAEKCLGCHAGVGKRFVDHRLYGAGHPRLSFELDTFTAIEPAHFVVDKGYIERKGQISDAQVWAVGQALAVVRKMDAALDPAHAHPGLFPEFAFYDCQSCHHPFAPLHGARPTAAGLDPGTVKYDDANALMLQLAAARIAPDTARTLGEHIRALDQAAVRDQAAVQREAAAVRDIATRLVGPLASHPFGDNDLRGMADAVIALGRAPDEWRFSHAEQVTMALESIVAAMKSSGGVGVQRSAAVETAMKALYASFAGDAGVRPEAFAAALREVGRSLGQ
jgi:hypothetical protein